MIEFNPFGLADWTSRADEEIRLRSGQKTRAWIRVQVDCMALDLDQKRTRSHMCSWIGAWFDRTRLSRSWCRVRCLGPSGSALSKEIICRILCQRIILLFCFVLFLEECSSLIIFGSKDSSPRSSIMFPPRYNAGASSWAQRGKHLTFRMFGESFVANSELSLFAFNLNVNSSRWAKNPINYSFCNQSARFVNIWNLNWINFKSSIMAPINRGCLTTPGLCFNDNQSNLAPLAKCSETSWTCSFWASSSASGSR